MAQPKEGRSSRKWKVVVGLLLVLCVSGNCSNDEIVLFDGSSLDGWAHTGPGYFEIDPEEKTLTSRGGMGMLFYYDRKFKDFELTLEWKANSKDANSGVFIRFPNLPQKRRATEVEGKNLAGPWGAVNEGYEIQICDDQRPKHRTGSLYSFNDSSEVPTKPVGEWNEMRIRVVGQRYEVSINGTPVGDYRGDRALSGYVGLQNHDSDSVATFRNIKIEVLEK